MARATLNAAEVSELLGVSSFTLYSTVKDGTCPLPPIKVGRRLIWPRSAVEKLLGLEPGALSGEDVP
jgi:predicted DNA-binding transcriptional regulator AlpA